MVSLIFCYCSYQVELPSPPATLTRPTQPPLLALPSEMFLSVLLMFDLNDLLKMATVCRYLYYQVNNERIWQAFYSKYFGIFLKFHTVNEVTAIINHIAPKPRPSFSTNVLLEIKKPEEVVPVPKNVSWKFHFITAMKIWGPKQTSFRHVRDFKKVYYALELQQMYYLLAKGVDLLNIPERFAQKFVFASQILFKKFKENSSDCGKKMALFLQCFTVLAKTGFFNKHKLVCSADVLDNIIATTQNYHNCNYWRQYVLPGGSKYLNPYYTKAKKQQLLGLAPKWHNQRKREGVIISKNSLIV